MIARRKSKYDLKWGKKDTKEDTYLLQLSAAEMQTQNHCFANSVRGFDYWQGGPLPTQDREDFG